MDPVVFWDNLIQDFNKENKCDFCWRFYAPMREIDLNLVRKKDECCVNVFLVWNGAQDFNTLANFDINKGIPINPIEVFNYQVFFLVPSKEGINNYNEIPNHPVDESRYETILRPIRECINYNIFNDLCLKFGITSFNGSYVYDYQDEMYYGIKLNITTQKRS